MNGTVAFITGGASGIGLATAKGFVSLGTAVAIIDHDAPALASAEDALRASGAAVMAVHADLSLTEQLDPLFRSVVEGLGRVDYLVNAAARVGGTYDLLEVQTSDWHQTLELNMTVPMLLMQCFARHAIERSGGGRIVNVTSSSAFRAQGTRPAYGSSKAGLGALTRIAAAQWGAHEINVNAVAPGITNTPGAIRAMRGTVETVAAKASSGPNANFFKRITEPEDVAATIVFLCSPGARQITGQTIHVSAGAVTL
jgi:NAD(P)-dependent dehydrogenase (short-subunit alcohol dehydrogenase family)